MEERALAGAMVVREMDLIGAVADCPLCSLFNSKEAELTVALPRRCLAFPLLGAHTTRGFSSAVTDEEDLFQTRNRLLRSPNHYSISN